MNRPKKTKPQDPLLPEDQQIDERNLIDLEDAAEISFEDKMNVYWMENKGFILTCILILFVAVIGFQGARIFIQHNETAHREAYAEARTNETLAEFAKKNSDSALGAFAALDIADEAYEAKEFLKAKEFYSIAASGLKGTLLEGRALIGQAFAQYSAGEQSDGLALLAAISANSDLSQASRAEAAYHMAIEADAAGRTDEFESYVAQIEEFNMVPQWQQRLSYYQESAR